MGGSNVHIKGVCGEEVRELKERPVYALESENRRISRNYIPYVLRVSQSSGGFFVCGCAATAWASIRFRKIMEGRIKQLQHRALHIRRLHDESGN